MTKTAVSALESMIKKLNKYQKEQLYAFLQSELKFSIVSAQLTGEVRETKFQEGLSCVHCKSKSIVRFGKYKGRQRYRCKVCERTYMDFTNTPFERTRYPEKWPIFIKCMFQGMSLRNSAQEVGVSWVTLFYWRHKLLTALRKVSIDKFEGIVEMDETYLLHSEKGNKDITQRKPRKRGGSAEHRGISHEQVCILVARDRSKNTIAKAVCFGKIDAKMIKETIGQHISMNNTICTDALPSFSKFAKEQNLKHYPFKTGATRISKGIYHIQNVNGYHSRFKRWLRLFKGVSTKYLNNYLAWHILVDSRGEIPTDSNIKAMLANSCIAEVQETYDSLRTAKPSFA